MKAYFSTAFGGSEVSVYGDYPDPSCGSSQVLVDVKAVSINPVDYKVRRGVARLIVPAKFPRIYGSDFAGVVRETGSGVTQFRPGDRVYGATPVFFGKAGALAERLAVDKKYVTHIPVGMTFEEAAALPVAALTALNGLRRCRVTAGKHVLINGSTGGVGHYAVQIAKAWGAVVTASCSPANATLARSLGADETAGYAIDELAAAGRKYDAIMDAYGKMPLRDIFRLLKRNGIYATTLANPFLSLPWLMVHLFTGRKITSANIRSRPEDMREMESLFLEKKMRPVIENTFPLEKAGEAFDMAETGRPRGKVIVTV